MLDNEAIVFNENCDKYDVEESDEEYEFKLEDEEEGEESDEEYENMNKMVSSIQLPIQKASFYE